MVGARQGWVEAPYGTVPCKPHGQPFARPDTRDPRIDVRVIPGLKQTNSPDVMRGEETQIAGLLAAMPNFDGVACLPGTHTKWVHISARRGSQLPHLHDRRTLWPHCEKLRPAPFHRLRLGR